MVVDLENFSPPRSVPRPRFAKEVDRAQRVASRGVTRDERLGGNKFRVRQTQRQRDLELTQGARRVESSSGMPLR